MTDWVGPNSMVGRDERVVAIVNLKTRPSTQSLGGAHRGRVSCVRS